MLTRRDYQAKVPGAAGHLCSRCAMTRESRARHPGNCPFSETPVRDLCPYYDQTKAPAAPVETKPC